MKHSDDAFNEEEYAEIIKQAKTLFQCGYFTGLNFISSKDPLPQESIVVHFLHDSQKHIDYIREILDCQTFVLPRETIYLLDPTYFNKIEFDAEYKNATFFDGEFKQISIDTARKSRDNLIVSHSEFDLLVPLNLSTLEDIILSIKQADATGPYKFAHLFIIIKSQYKLKTLHGFVNSTSYVNIRKNFEEFYTVLHDENPTNALRDLIKSCQYKKMGKLSKHNISFDIGQINEEALEYILKNINPLRPLV